MKEYTVDRIENGIVVCISDDDKVHKVPVASIPFAVSEGDILVFGDEENPTGKNEAKSNLRRSHAQQKLNALFERRK